jgi:hypothetical protein
VTTIEHHKESCEKLKVTLAQANITNVNLICSPVAWTELGTRHSFVFFFLDSPVVRVRRVRVCR